MGYRTTPRVLGVDDWAFRKRRRYGTILVDLERGCPVELLPNRDAESFTQWLQEHKGVEVISRDRGDCYIKGATEGAPQAVQVADRFHLVQNLRDALGRLLDRHSKSLLVAVQETNQTNNVAEPMCETFAEVESTVAPEASKSNAAQKRSQIYETVMSLHKEGRSNRAIAQTLGIHRETVAKFLRSDGFPQRSRRHYRSETDPYAAYLWKRWQEGCRNAIQLTKEIERLGFTASYSSVRRRVAKWRKAAPKTPPTAKRIARPSSSRLSWLLIKEQSQLSDEDKAFRSAVMRHCKDLQPSFKLAFEFMKLIRKRSQQSLLVWLKNAEGEKIAPELQRFAKGLKSDMAAVTAAMTSHWSNGQSEGQINRLKTLKRQMYGRANFDLLRKRMPYSPN